MRAGFPGMVFFGSQERRRSINATRALMKKHCCVEGIIAFKFKFKIFIIIIAINPSVASSLAQLRSGLA